MAECSHARCMQERRAIKKQLQRWTKNMVYVVGLERVAEELMGRRKWRQLGTIGTWDEATPTASATDSPADTSGHPSPSKGPQDFEPRQDLQCCFCDDPLDTSTRIASDSEDDSGSVASESSTSRPIHHNMTTLEAVTSMAASLAAVAALKSSQGANASSAPTSTTSSSPTAGVASLYPLTHHAAAAGLLPAWYLTSPHAAAVAAVAAAQQTPLEPSSPGPGPSPAGSAGFLPSGASSSSPITPTGEMPLDLSAKAAIAALAMEREALRVPDSKNIFKARPRANTALSQRRTYTEDELQAALRDIQSGKLGTRRAAVIYGIPRSTLRNKVYKLTMERKCDPSSLVMAGADPTRLPLAALALPPDDDDGVISGGDDDPEKPLKLDTPVLAPESLRLLLQQGMRRSAGGASEGSEEGASPPPPGLPPQFAGAEHWNLDYHALAPYISKLLGAHQSLLARNVTASTTAGGDSPGAESPGSRDGASSDFLPKFPSPLLPDFLYRMMADERERELHQRSSQFHNGAGGDRDEKQGASSPSVCKSETDDDGAAGSTRAPSPPNVILKIPSFKPTSKNGGVPLDAAGVYSRCSSSSSPVIGQQGDSSQHSETSPGGSSSPPASQTFANKALAAKFPHLRLGPTSPIFDLKRTHYGAPTHHALTESVIKSMQQQSHHSQQQGARPSAQGSGGSSNQQSSGKGTRPKRGKYRNYDRDALNEAVKAVQRGEMSVHRAGSFYGVPHSTLEYKVKERHLMRPRKRDPKPPGSEEKPKQEVNVLRMPTGDKLPPPGASKPKPFIQTPLGAPQNGLKNRFERFDPSSISSLAAATYSGIPPFPFWGAGYAPLPLDFSGPTSFNANTTKQFLASQMMQRLQDSQEGSRTGAGGAPAGQGHQGGPSGPGPGPGPGPGSGQGPGAAALALGLKRSRDIAESMDDSSGEHATLLDGIIRYGLEKGLPSANTEAVENLSNKALLDQLCRNSRLDGRLEGRSDGSRIDAPRLRTSSSSEDDEVRRPPMSLLQPGVVHLSPSSGDSSAVEREEKNCNASGDGDVDREDDDRPCRPSELTNNPNSFQLNHSPPQTARANQDNERPDSQPSVNGLEAARSASRAELDELVKSACDSKLRVDSRVSGVGPEEDGAKDSSEDQVRDEDTKTQEIS